MTLIVEDGTVVTGANSYVSTSDLTAFALARSVTLVSAPEPLLIQAMDYIEGLDYKGDKLRQTQPLKWPRVGILIDGYYNSSNTIPQSLKDGLMHTAIAIDQGNDPLKNITQSAVRKKVGEIEIQYSSGSSQNTISRKIMNALSQLLESASGSGQLKVGKA